MQFSSGEDESLGSVAFCKASPHALHVIRAHRPQSRSADVFPRGIKLSARPSFKLRPLPRHILLGHEIRRLASGDSCNEENTVAGEHFERPLDTSGASVWLKALAQPYNRGRVFSKKEFAHPEGRPFGLPKISLEGSVEYATTPMARGFRMTSSSLSVARPVILAGKFGGSWNSAYMTWAGEVINFSTALHADQKFMKSRGLYIHLAP
jgi:hypothetical protein